jgi:hypothetical protein
MGAAIQATRAGDTTGGLRALAARSRDGAQVRRLLALAMALDGRSGADAAMSNGMDRQTLCDWVRRCHDEGADGLRTSPGPGRPPYLTEAQRAELEALALQGHDPPEHNVARWRCWSR